MTSATLAVVIASSMGAIRPLHPVRTPVHVVLRCPKSTRPLTTWSPEPNREREEACVQPNGVRNGPCRVYYLSGAVHQEGQYSHGKKDGQWITYDPLGMKIEEGKYRRGCKVGTWIEYMMDGYYVTTQYLNCFEPGVVRMYDGRGRLVKTLFHKRERR